MLALPAASGPVVERQGIYGQRRSSILLWKGEACLRVFSNNVNGLSTELKGKAEN